MALPDPRDPKTVDPALASTLTATVAGPVASVDHDPLIGARVGDYVVTERLGVGGMGMVYAAIHPLIGKAVAVKVLRPEIARDPEQARLLFAEAAVMARIRHRGIIDVFNVGRLDDGRHYLVMELLGGESLHEILRRRGALPLYEALELFDEILAAVGAAHQVGVVHRDLKPSNIFLVTQSDGASYVKLLDFGLAMQSQSATGETPPNPSESLVGTPEYLAPEQARVGTIGPYTDLYSAAVVLFQMLTGRLPFQAKTPVELMLHHLETIAPAPSRFAPVPRQVDELILRMLAKVPERRPQSVSEVRAELAPLRRLGVDGSPVPNVRSDSSVESSFTVRVGTRFELGLSWLTPSLKGLRAKAPERAIQLHFGDSPDLLRLLRNGQLDCAVTSARLRGDWLRRADLHEETYTFVAAPSALGPGGQFDPSALQLGDVHDDLPLFRYLLDAHPPARSWRFQGTEILGTIAAVAHRVLEGDAVAVLPNYFIVDHLKSGALVALEPSVVLQRDCFRLIWRDGHPREAELQQLAKELRAIPLR